MKRGGTGRVLLALGTAVACFLCSGLARVALSGTPAPAAAAPTRPAGATEAPIPAESPTGTPKTNRIFDQSPDEQYDERERADPFTLGRLKDGPIDTGTGEGGGGGKPPPPRGEWEKKLQESQTRYAEVEMLLSSEYRDRFSKVASECQSQLSSLKTDITDLRKKGTVEAVQYLNQFQAMAEKFQRLEATARRLQSKAEIEAEFAAKKIRIEGIIWRASGPVAAVNGRSVTEGQFLTLGGEKGATEERVQVYRIRRDSVVFIYKGMQVSADLPRGSL